MATKASKQDALKDLMASSQAPKTASNSVNSPAPIPDTDKPIKVSLYLSPSENRRLLEKFEIKRAQVRAEGRQGRYSFSTFLAEILADN